MIMRSCLGYSGLTRRRRSLLLPLLLLSVVLAILKYVNIFGSLPISPTAFKELQNLGLSSEDIFLEQTVFTPFSQDKIQLIKSFKYKLPLPDVSLCSGRLVSFGEEFVRLRGVVIDRKFFVSKRRGGEAIEEVLHQAEADEYYRVASGGFRFDGCTTKLDVSNNISVSYSSPSIASLSFNAQNHLAEWKDGIKLTDKTGDSASQLHGAVSQQNEFTIAVKRYEYVNLYHTMTDWYNAFLISRVYFNHTDLARDYVNILWIDSHPVGSLDSVWSVLFKSSRRLAELAPGETYFADLVLGWQGYRSPLYVRSPHLPPPPLLSEFREFFLSSYNIQSRSRVTNCLGADEPAVLFIWRHNYVAHPRNPVGNIMRKIGNEEELLSYVRNKFPKLRVTGIQMDELTMEKQLQLVADSDILIGMHGAGLTHAIFLPENSALIELTTNSYSSQDHFAAIAAWRRLYYQRWTVSNNDLPAVVKPSVVEQLIANAVRHICPSARQVDLGLSSIANNQ